MLNIQVRKKNTSNCLNLYTLHFIGFHAFTIMSKYMKLLQWENLKRGEKGGSAPAEILLKLIAVTKLANPETLDVTEKKTFIHIVSLLYS